MVGRLPPSLASIPPPTSILIVRLANTPRNNPPHTHIVPVLDLEEPSGQALLLSALLATALLLAAVSVPVSVVVVAMVGGRTGGGAARTRRRGAARAAGTACGGERHGMSPALTLCCISGCV